MGMTVQGPDGSAIVPQMGSYGIGVSRLMGAIIEANHDDNGIIWPESVAPYKAALINLRADDSTCAAAADALYGKLIAAGGETLTDDRDDRGAPKLTTPDLPGLPWPRGAGPQ